MIGEGHTDMNTTVKGDWKVKIASGSIVGFDSKEESSIFEIFSTSFEPVFVLKYKLIYY